MFKVGNRDTICSVVFIVNFELLTLNMSFPNGILYCLNLNLSVYFRVRSKLCHIKEDVFCHKDLYLRRCIRFELKILIYLIHKISKRFCGVEGGHSPWSSAILWEYEKLTLLDALKIHFQRFFTLAFLHIISNRLNQHLKFALAVGKCWGFY